METDKSDIHTVAEPNTFYLIPTYVDTGVFAYLHNVSMWLPGVPPLFI